MKRYALGKTGCPVLRLFPRTCCPWQANPGAVMRRCGMRNDGQMPGDKRTGEVET